MHDVTGNALPSKLWVYASAGITAVVNAFAFAMSLIALTDLASHRGVPGWQAWMLPSVLEGATIGATIGLVTLEDKKQRRFAWTVITASTSMSASLNIAHAYANTGGNILAMVIAAIPPLWMLACTHLTMMMLRQGSKVAATVKTVVAKPLPIVAAPRANPLEAIEKLIAPQPAHT